MFKVNLVKYPTLNKVIDNRQQAKIYQNDFLAVFTLDLKNLLEKQLGSKCDLHVVGICHIFKPAMIQTLLCGCGKLFQQEKCCQNCIICFFSHID